VKAVVGAHGGEVEAADREEGGARVTVWLPREAAGPAEA
jgi:signal transduction histidine kinase